MIKLLAALATVAAAGSAYANAYADLEKCETLRPRICGQKGAPTCAEVQEKIDACKAKVREDEVRRINNKDKDKK